MKASRLSTSTNSWFVGNDFELDGGKIGAELIVQFKIGNAKGYMRYMKSNAMTAFPSTESGGRMLKANKTNRVALTSGVADGFHTYGVWWVDANTLKFHADGQYVCTIKPSTQFDDKPFRHPLTDDLI